MEWIVSSTFLDPQLRSALEKVPSFEVSSETLSDIRAAVGGFVVPAPAVSGVVREERLIARPDGGRLRLLVYIPEDTTPQGGLLWLHGGGMVMASPDGNDPQSRYFAKEANCVVVAPDYRLAPENPYPAALEDCYATLRWMHEKASVELGFPGTRIAVAGESGGGCLAAGLTLLARDRGEVSISAQFLEYPMLDDRTGTEADPDPMPLAGEYVWTRASNTFAWHAVLGGAQSHNTVPIYASPGRATDLTSLPLTAIFIGGLDLFIGENFRFAKELTRAGVPVDFHVFPGAYHGFISFAQAADVSKQAFAEFAAAIKRHFSA